jgi:hypothetical protein
MSKHICIAVGAAGVHALWVQSGALRWYAQAPLPDRDHLEAALCTMLSAAPRGRSRARATVVLSPRWVQTRQLQGLPAVASARTAAQLVRENEQSFFLWHGRPAMIVAQFARDRAAWAAAFDADCLDAVVRAARAARLRVVQIAPAVAAIAAAFPNERIVWPDGEDAFAIQGTLDGLADLRRVTAGATTECAPLPDLLRPIGACAYGYIPALAAAQAPHRLPLGWRPCADPARLRRRRSIANAAACIALAAATAAAAAAPSFRASLSARASERQLQGLAATRRDLASAQAELRRVSDGLDHAARFAAERGGITRLLATLSGAAPESTAILDIRVDSVEGSFTAIAPHVADLLPVLTTAEGIDAPQIIGPVSRQIIAGARLERASFRFRRPRAAHGPAR